MIRKVFLTVALATLGLCSRAQEVMETGVVPPDGGSTGAFTEWKKVEFTSGGEKCTYEYRIAFQKRKALACNYELVLKNTSTGKLKLKVKTHYYDKLVKNNFGDEFKATAKAGQEQSFWIITQGCKADKDKGEQSDFDRCKACGLTYEIYAERD